MNLSSRRAVLWSLALLVATSATAGLAGGAAHARQPARVLVISAAAGTVVRLHQRVVQVSIANYAFSPARLVVSPGTRIVWTNKDGDPHTVKGTAGGWASEALDTGNPYAHVFKHAGTFTYYCAIHPFMHGTIVVKK
jgi:plastocyanin